jgi:N,N-dimethylformamidase beta subunit-like protein
MTMKSTLTAMTGRIGLHRLFLAGAALAVCMNAGLSAQQDPQVKQPDVADDPTISGFATEDAVAAGAAVHFKIETDAPAFSISIYRFWNGEAPDDLVETLPAPPAPQVQPPCSRDEATGALDCSNWSQSAAWTVPDYTDPGTYYALLRRADTGGVNHILFVVAAR